jgi:hypothetical protein
MQIKNQTICKFKLNAVSSVAALAFAATKVVANAPPLGNNRALRTNLIEKPRTFTRPNIDLIRVSVASRLMSMHWKASGENLKGSSVIGCGRWKNYGADQNFAEIEVGFDGPRLAGHFRCKSVWSCEPCARARVQQTRSWIRAALMPALTAQNLSGSLVTLTLAHAYDEDWKDVVARLFDAFRHMDMRLKRDYQRAGVLGKLKSLEAPVGVNGIHPHLHLLVIHAKDADLDELSDSMFLAWREALENVGGHCSDKNGFDFKKDCVNDYVAKLSTSHELASQGTKTAKRKGRLFSDLLTAAGRGDKKSGAEWIRAMAAIGGRMRFHAGGLPKKLGIVSPSSWLDEERAEETAKKKAEFGEVTRITYEQILHMKATGTGAGRAGLAIILRSARTADSEKVLRTVDALCAEIDRKENPITLQNLYRSESEFDEILAAASTRILRFDEIELYREAKKRQLEKVNL